MLDFLKNIKEEKKKPAELFVEGSDVEKIFREGLATITDLIAPSALDIGSNFIQVGETFAKTIFVTTYPRYLHTAWFSPIINLDVPMDIAMSIYPVESVNVMKSLRRRITQVESEIHLEAEAGKVRDPALETALQDIEQLRDQLQQGTERFFRFGLYITIYGKSKLEAEKSAQFIESLLESRLTYVKEAVFRSEQGFSSTLPLANDELNVSNNMNSQPLSTTFPFVSSDLSSSSGILYGINRHNNSLVLFDRFEMENANMVIFAKSGAGKSYAVKLEILRSLMFGTDVIVIDPENEYQFLCEAIGGSFINISLTSNYHLNPFDLPDIGENEDLNDILRNNKFQQCPTYTMCFGTWKEGRISPRALKNTPKEFFPAFSTTKATSVSITKWLSSISATWKKSCGRWQCMSYWISSGMKSAQSSKNG